MSNSLQTHEIQYARLPCPSLFQSLLRLMLIELMIPPNHLALCCHLMLLLSIFPSIWVFFQWIGCSQQVVKVLELQLQHSLNIPMNIQGWFPLGLTGLISLLSEGLSRVFFGTTVQKFNSLAFRLLYGSTLTSIHDYWKNDSFDYTNLCQQSDASPFNTLSRFVIVFFQ